MTEKAKEARRAYKREWAKNNPDKIRSYQANYWDKKAQAALEDQQARQPQEVQQAQAAGA